MSKVIEQHRANKLVQAILGYMLQFYNGLDDMLILNSGASAPGSTDIAGALDKSLAQQKWDLFNDWLQTSGTWQPPAGTAQSYRISQDFINHFDTIPVWLENTVLTEDDPYGLFLSQQKDRRVQWTINGVKHRHRV